MAYYLFHSHVALAVDERADTAADTVGQLCEPGLGLLGLATHGHPHGDLRKAGAEGQAALVLPHRAGNQFVQAGLADAEGLEGAAEEHLSPATHLPQPGQDGLLHHRLHFTWHSWEDDQVLAAVRSVEIHPIARRRAEVVGDDGRAGREVCLFEVVFRHRAVERGKDAADALSHLFRKEQPDPGNLGDQLGRQIVRRRANAAGRDDDVSLGERLLPGPDDAVGHVTYGDDCNDLDSGLDQFIGEVVGIGIDHLAGGDLVPGAENGRAFDHRKTLTNRKPLTMRLV